MQLRMLLAADYATVDASGKLNILGAFTHISAHKFPVKHQLMHLVVKLQSDLGELSERRKLRVILVDEDGNELFHISNDFNPPLSQAGQQPEFTAILAIRDLEFPKPGAYEFRVFVDKELKGYQSIQLTQISNEQPQE